MSQVAKEIRARAHSVTRQDELDAEFILEKVLHRKRYPGTTRTQLATALAQVRAGHPLKRGRGGAPK